MSVDIDETHQPGCPVRAECLDCTAAPGEPCADWCRSAGSVCTCTENDA